MFAMGFLKASFACSLLASAVNAHMVITKPVPYGQSTLTNSPLEDDGSDFPCKQRAGVYDITEMNYMPVGVPQTLSFMGGATHGGGSCQLSVTLDQQPDQNSDWKVIYTILGGCPSNYTGNLSDDADGTNASVFEFSMPQGMPNGQYTLAWTWFNKIGNREMYMNCAPITVTGGADNNDVLETLPTMWVMNIPFEQCSSVEGEDFNFPDPGLYVETAFTTALGSSTTGTGCASMTKKGAGDGSLGTAPTAGSVTGMASGSTASAAADTTPANAATITSQAAASQTPAVVQNNDAVTSTVIDTITDAGSNDANTAGAPAPSQSVQVNGSNTSSSSGSCAEGSIACSAPGNVVCIGSTQWGLCDIDNCAVTQSLADGTSCSNGQISRKRHLVGHLMRHRSHRAAHAL